MARLRSRAAGIEESGAQRRRRERRDPQQAERSLIAAAFMPVPQKTDLQRLWRGVVEPEVTVRELEGFLSGKSACSSPGPSQLRYGHIKHGSWALKQAVCVYASAIISGQMEGERGEGQRQRHGRQARREKWTPGALLSTLTYLRKKPGVAMKSYRPVTLQQALTKIVTGIVAARLTEAIAQGAVLDPAQAGFVRGGEVGTQLQSLCAILEHALQARRRTGGAYAAAVSL